MVAIGNRRRWLAGVALAASLLAPVVVVACGDEESATPKCPDLPLFAVRDLEGDAATAEAIAAFEKWKAAAKENEPCVTAPGTATIPDANFTGG